MECGYYCPRKKKEASIERIDDNLTVDLKLCSS